MIRFRAEWDPATLQIEKDPCGDVRAAAAPSDIWMPPQKGEIATVRLRQREPELGSRLDRPCQKRAIVAPQGFRQIGETEANFAADRRHGDFRIALPLPAQLRPSLPVSLNERRRHGLWFGRSRGRVQRVQDERLGGLLLFARHPVNAIACASHSNGLGPQPRFPAFSASLSSRCFSSRLRASWWAIFFYCERLSEHLDFAQPRGKGQRMEETQQKEDSAVSYSRGDASREKERICLVYSQNRAFWEVRIVVTPDSLQNLVLKFTRSPVLQPRA